MRMRYAWFFALIFSYCFGPAVWAQTQQSTTETTGRKLIRRVDPKYPEVARKMNLGGTVRVIATIAPDGNVAKVEPLGGSPLLVQAAESAVSQWKFAAGPETKETVELRFTP